MEKMLAEYGLAALVAFNALFIVRELVRGIFAWLKAREEKTERREPDPSGNGSGNARLRLELRDDRALEKISDSLIVLTGILKDLTRTAGRIETKVDDRFAS